MYTKINRRASGAKGFTLLELIIVIAIIAILATILIIVINPVETLRRARDVQRLSDLSTLKTSIALYLTLDPSADLGTCSATAGATPNTVYYSLTGITDSSVAGGASVVATSAQTVDGNGWIPINFNSMSGGSSPISNLPLDPLNTVTSLTAMTASSSVYRYACADSPVSFELNARLESTEFQAKHGTDGGNNAELYEVGTRLDILPASLDF